MGGTHATESQSKWSCKSVKLRAYCFYGASAWQTLLANDNVVVSKPDLCYDGAAKQFFQSLACLTHQTVHNQKTVSLFRATVQ